MGSKLGSMLSQRETLARGLRPNRGSSGRGLWAPQPGTLTGSKLHSSSQQGKLRVGPPGAAATGALTGFQVRFHVDTCSKTSIQQGKLWAGPPGAKATGTLTGSKLDSTTQRETLARGLRPNRGSSGRGLRAPKPQGHLPGSKLSSTLTQPETQRLEDFRAPQPRGRLPGSILASTLTQRETLARGLRPNRGSSGQGLQSSQTGKLQ